MFEKILSIFGSGARKQVPTEAPANSPQLAPLQPVTAPLQPQSKGYAEAKKRIAAWPKKSAKEKEKEFNLNGLKLTDVPPEIASLTQLGKLNLSDNMLGDHGVGPLASLTSLTWLFLMKNRIGAEGAKALANLRKLGTLDLTGNKIGDEGAKVLARLPLIKKLILDSNEIGRDGAKALAGLSKLHTLSLYGNRIDDDGVTAFAGLTAIKKLNLSRNKLGAEGAKSLANLKTLISLTLGDNQIGTEGASALCGLRALVSLDLSHTGIEDLSFLAEMTKLTTINLNGLRLRSAETAILRRKGLQRVYLHQAQLGDVPPELLSKHVTDNCLPRLRAYFAAQDEAEARESDIIIRDVKVMILGNGRIGKTQMRRRLSGLDFDERVPSTHGVEIVSTDLPLAANAPAGAEATPLKIWDFGGQDIYLGTHALFLKTRAVFPILWTPQSEANATYDVDGHVFRNYPLTEWVRFVQRLAGEKSPVLLVQTKCDAPGDRHAPPIEQKLMQAFAYRPRELDYSALPDRDQEGLLLGLRDAVAWLGADGPRRISARWGGVKAAIEARAAAGDKSMTRAEFDEVCAAEKVKSKAQRDTLLGLLHEFGTVFHDPEVLRDLIILDQNWALQAIYALFDRQKGAYDFLYGRCKGRFTRSDLGGLLWDAANYSQADQEAFIAMMVSCKVAFPLRAASEQDGEALYIAPDLLPERAHVAGEIARGFQEDEVDATCEIPFAFAVPSLLRELMGLWGAEAGQHGLYWREGLTFYDIESKSRALIEAIRPEDRSWRATIRIQTWTGDATTLMERLQAKVLEVGERFGAQIEPGHEAAALGTLDVGDEGVAELQDQPRPYAPIIPGPVPLAREQCFISYARGDEKDDAGVARAQAFEAVRERLRAINLDPLDDTQNRRHGESISAFINSAAQAPKFVLILSQKYLESPWCMDELLRIWRACGSDKTTFQARVRAICLKDAQIKTVEHREAVSLYWAKEGERYKPIVQNRIDQQLDVPPDYNQTLRVAVALTQAAPEILGCIADSVNIRDLADIDKLVF